MTGSPKARVCVVAASRVVESVIREFTAVDAYDLVFEPTITTGMSLREIDVFVVDVSQFADGKLQLRDKLLGESPSALVVGLLAPGESTQQTGEAFDWTIDYENLREGIDAALKVLSIVRKKAYKGAFFDELLLACMTVKHDASNSLMIAKDASTRLGKLPDIAENNMYIQMTRALDAVIKQVRRLADIQEKFRVAAAAEPGLKKIDPSK